MATWTLKHDTGLDPNFWNNYAETDGELIYFAWSDDSGIAPDDIYSYDPATDTLTQISNSASWDTDYGSIGLPIRLYNGSLYYLTYHNTGTPNIKLMRYSGSGTGWDLVFTGDDNYQPTDIIGTDGSLVIVTAASPTDIKTYYSPSWAAADGLPSIYEELVGWDHVAGTGGFEFGIYIIARDDPQTQRGLLVWGGSSWAVAEDYATTILPKKVSGDGLWYLVSGNIRFSSDLTTFETPSIDLSSINSFNNDYSWGLVGATDSTIYLYDAPATWNSDGTLTDVSATDFTSSVVRLDNGEVYILVNNSDTDTTQIWERDALLDPPVSNYTHSAGGLPGSILVA